MSSSPFSFVFYLLKVINGNTETLCEICSKSTIKTLAQRHWCCTDVFTAIFEQISHIFFDVFIIDFEQVNGGLITAILSTIQQLLLENTGEYWRGTPAWNGGRHHCRLPNETHYPCQEQNIFLLIRTFHGGAWIISYR